MKLSKIFFKLICLVIPQALASPVTLAANAHTDFLQNAPSKESDHVKKRSFEDNGDRHLKQISLSSLVGDLEKNIFASALSLNKGLADKDVSIPEIKVKDDRNEHQSLTKQKRNNEPTATLTTTESSANLTVTDKIILQTTEKVPQANGEPAHIVIDRISIQPHTVGVASIPIFELKQTEKHEYANRDGNITNTEIPNTGITNLPTASPDLTTISPITSFSALNPTTATSATTTEDALESLTTPNNIEKLKEAEEELKEKFAEIEADPIILSARV